MRIAVPHHTTREKARLKLNTRLQQLLAQFGGHAEEIEHEWKGDTLTFKGKARGFTVSGTVDVTDAEVILDAKLPILARPFEGRIRQSVEGEVASMFRKA